MGLSIHKVQKLDSAMDKCAMVFVPPLSIEKIRNWGVFFNTIAQFTKTRSISIHSVFYQWRMIDDNQKRFVPHLAIDTDFFHSVFVNPCMMQNQRRSQSGVCLTAHLPIECLMANYCTRWRQSFEGLSLDGGWADFLKNLCDTSFNKDVSNEHLC